jgi:putative restriction endonuclease
MRSPGRTSPRRSELLRSGVAGGFTPEVATILEADPGLAYSVAHTVLDAHFPISIQADVLEAVGLEDPAGVSFTRVRRRRDPRFRVRVLAAYAQRCAICGFDVRLGSGSVGLDAAHIQWHQAGGPDIEQNGFALCALHHKLFDRGAFTVSHDHTVELSQHVHGGDGFGELLLRFHEQPIRRPQSPAYLPGGDFLDWHYREVFQRPRRSGSPVLSP